ncbi:HAD-IC family P-type ATPase [bacterium]|nr:HAD-IC family P-type ATPase [bacterium]
MRKNQVDIQFCYHCGEEVKGAPIQYEGHQFCCNGCKGAYELLLSNNLCDYYTIDKNPGNNLRVEIDPTEYEYLDNSHIIRKLLNYSDGKTARVTLNLPQIHCSSCIWLLENLQTINAAIFESRVNFSKKTIHITFNEQQTSLRQVVELLASLGYVPTLNLNSVTEAKTQNTNRSLYYKLGVAGFAFGNIMLMSFPEYIGISGDFTSQFQLLFRWFNVALAVPVLLYSGSDYLQNALTAVKTRILNLDVPIVIGMLALFARSVYEVASGIGAGYFDSLVGFIFFLLLGKFFQTKTYSHLSFERDFKSFFPLAVLAKVEGEFVPVEVNQLSVADIIMIKSGQIVPCDSILLSSEARIDYSFVTGESNPVVKKTGDLIYAGGKQVGGAIELLVDKRVEESYLTELWQKENSDGKGQVAQVADVVGKYFTFTILAVALFTFVYWSFSSLQTAFLAFTSVLIVACPCALALSVPFTHGTAMRWLAKHGFFMKSSAIVEKLAHINRIVFDKTGTLTHSKNAAVTYDGKTFDEYKDEVISLVFQSSHPLSEQIAQHLGQAANPYRPSTFEEIPGAGIKGVVNGVSIKLGNEQFVLGEQQDEIQSAVYLQINGAYYGRFSFSLNYRNGFEQVLNQLRNRFELFLISGDNNKEQQRLATHFGGEGHVLFNKKPHEKEAFVCALKQDTHKVAMVGDGLNDAGALNAADLGISVTDDVNNFTPASDAIIRGDVLQDLPAIFKYALASEKVIYAAFAISFAYNLLGLSFAVQGMLSPVVSAILMPLSSITVVVFTTLTTTLLAKKYRIV